MNEKEIGIVMDSEEVLPVMQEATKVLDRFGLPYTLDILETHKNPTRMIEYAKSLATSNIMVVIAGASGAAHLPGMIAAFTPKPVIGVPIKSENSIDGLDAIYSMLQMPKGVPVATMALNEAANAALFALQILGCKHPSYYDLVMAFKKQMREEEDRKANKLVSLGVDKYLESIRL
ncbi:MAG: 5-(carboxyamino)imidazole ribonucleotide mutase [Bacteroidetes bacterium]|nr:5-(carboxyamino)imidazole ribonucleotide mutase [Bacteroidota bacterium]